MHNTTFNGARLKNARLFRGFTLTEVANRTGISKQSLSLYENSRNVPEHERIQVISKELQFPMEFFFQKDKCETTTEVTYFRSLASATKMARTAQSIKLEYVAKIYEILLDYIDFPSLHLPDVDFNGTDDEFDDEGNIETIRQIEKVAHDVREFWGVGNLPIQNLQLLLEKNGIIITGFDTMEDKIDAFSQRTIVCGNGVYFIAIALGQKPEGRIMFDIAHELGHILLHPWSENLELITKEEFKAREKQANIFASAFLMPSDGFGKEMKMYSAYATDLGFYQSLKKRWHTSIQAMLYRCNSLNILSDNQFQYLMRQVSKKGWRTKEPGDEPYALNDNIFQGAIDLLIEKHILDASEILRIFKNRGINFYRDDIEKLLNLRKGTLFIKEQQAKIIQLKYPNNAKE